MLEQIHIQNFVLINQLTLDLKSGMSVITGETGAGKSIAIDALTLALGARLDGQVVREHAKQCSISLVFNIRDNDHAKSWLKNHDYDFEDIVILRRVISQEGKSRIYINDQATNLSIVTELGQHLVNIHAQHQHQALLARDEQRELLDQFAGSLDTVKALNHVYQQWRNIQEQLIHFKKQQNEFESRRDFLSFQIKELSELPLETQDLDQLNAVHKMLTNTDKLTTACQSTLEVLTENDNKNIQQLLNYCIRTLEPFKTFHPSFTTSVQALESCQVNIEETAHELNHYLSQLEIDPEKLQDLERKLSQIHDAARKYRVSAAELLPLYEKLTQEFQSLEHGDETIQQLQTQLFDLQQQYFTAAEMLTKQRKKATGVLNKKITENMQELGLQGGKFEIALQTINPEQPQLFGMEKIEFLVSTNPGQSLQPLTKVVSGGELARISLAIQVILAEKIQTPTMIFDEVDVGIGGKTAGIVGALLKKLGTKAQVICITHLPQVAACGKYHFCAQKSHDPSGTTTQLKSLNDMEKIEEIARMLGGIKITDQTRAHAKEMLEA